MEHIRQYVALDSNSSVPLYLQIRKGLQEWITALNPGQRLPPERDLASWIQFNRNSIKKAMQAFIREGILVRNVKGTFVAGKSGERPGAMGHPFAFHTSAFIAEPETIRIVLFENLPAQQKVWNRILERFHQAQRHIRVEIEWLPIEINMWELYETYIRQKCPDLGLLSYEFARQLKEEGLLAPLPEDLAGELHRKEYCSEIIGLDADGVLSHMVPLHFSVAGVLWNEELVGKTADSNSVLFDQERLFEWMVATQRHLPDSDYLHNMPLGLALASGVPVFARTEKEIMDFFKASFKSCSRLKGINGKLLWEQADSDEYRRLFCEGKTAFYSGSLANLLMDLPALTFPWKGALLMPRRGCYMSTGFSCVGVMKEGRRLQSAFEFARFLATPQVQSEFSNGWMNMAYHRGSNRHLLTQLGNPGDQAFRRIVKRLYLYDTVEFNWYRFMIHPARFLYREVIEGKRTPLAAVAGVREMLKQQGVIK